MARAKTGNMVNAKHIEVLNYIVFLILGVPIAICLGLAVLATMLCAATLPVGDVAPIPFLH